MPNLSIILPCYNESKNIPLIFQRFGETLAGRNDVEVVMVNNGSTDDSKDVFEKYLLIPENAFAKLVVVDVNRGYGYGILMGLKAASSKTLAWTHADMQTDPNDVLLSYDLFQKQGNPDQCLVKGSRKGRNLVDAFFTWGMGAISSFALGVRLRDINAQPKLFCRSFFESLDDPPYDFSLDLYILYKAARRNMRILEQPVHFVRRLYGEAKGGGTMKGKIKLIWRTWSYIFTLRRRIASVNMNRKQKNDEGK